MKVAVANPPWPGEGYGTRSNVRWPHRRGDKVLTFPIYLAYTVSVLKKSGFNVVGIDAVDKEWGIFRFVDEMKKINPKVILLETSTPSVMYDLQTAELVKKELPDTFVVFCGPHASYFHKDIIDNYRFIDGCIRNEFEYTMRDLCKALKNNESLDTVKGLTFRKGYKTRINPPMPLIENLDELPFPNRDFFKVENYRQAFFTGKKPALMITSRGCPYYCTFCLWPDALFGHKFRQRSPKNIVDEIEYLIKNYGVDELFFDDDTFALKNPRTQEICREILKRKIKIPWRCMARVDTVDLETLKIMKKAGCSDIFYGFESGSQKILHSVKKGITLNQITNAVKMTKKAGIVASGSFIIGTLEESKETIKKTLRFAIKLHPDYVQFALASPFPGTKLYDDAKRLNLMEIDSWADLDGSRGSILNTKYLKKKQLPKLLRQLYLRYYTSPRVIFQNILMIRSFWDIKRITRGLCSVLSRIFYYKK